MTLGLGLGLGIPLVVVGSTLSVIRFRHWIRIPRDDRPPKDLLLGLLAIVWGLGVGFILAGVHPKS